MSFIEDLGDNVINFLQNIIFHLLGLMIKVLKFGRNIFGNFERFESEKIYPTFEKKNIEFKDYIILKLQISSLLFLVLSVSFIFDILGNRKFLFLAIITGLYSLHLLSTNVKELFEKDYAAYRDFFISYIAISIALIVIKRVKPVVNYLFPYFHLVLASLIGVIAIDVWFKAKHGRDYTIGRVIESGSLVRVKINYDICASIKPSIQTFENNIKAKEGDLVKLMVEKGFLNLKGSKVTGIIGVVDG